MRFAIPQPAPADIRSNGEVGGKSLSKTILPLTSTLFSKYPTLFSKRYRYFPIHCLLQPCLMLLLKDIPMFSFFRSLSFSFSLLFTSFSNYPCFIRFASVWLILYHIAPSSRLFLFFVTSPSQSTMPLLIPSFRYFYFFPYFLISFYLFIISLLSL